MLSYPKKIKAIRAVLGLNQNELANIFNYKEDTLQKWESGKHEIPIDVRIKIDLMFGREILQENEDVFINMTNKIDNMIHDMNIFIKILDKGEKDIP